MRAKILLILCLVCIGGGVSALEGVFTGINTELNGSSSHGAAMSGGLVLGFDLHTQFGLGLKVSYNPNLYEAGALEPMAFFRYYLLNSLSGPFAQVEAGSTIVFIPNKNLFVFTGGLTAGWRINLASNFYLEPAMRMGYPFLFGVGFSAGVIFHGAGSRE